MTRPIFDNITQEEAAAAKKVLPETKDYLLAQSCLALIRAYALPLDRIELENKNIILRHSNPRFDLADGASGLVSVNNRMPHENYVIFDQLAEMLNTCFGKTLAKVKNDYPTRIIVDTDAITSDDITRTAGKIRGYIADNAPMKKAFDAFKEDIMPVLANRSYQAALLASGMVFEHHSPEHYAFENYATIGAEIQHIHADGMLALFPHKPLLDRGDKAVENWLKKVEEASRALDTIEIPLREHIKDGTFRNQPGYAFDQTVRNMLDGLKPDKVEEAFRVCHQACELLASGAQTLLTARQNTLSRGK